MKTLLIGIAVVSISILHAQARIGETRAQIAARYGNGKAIRERLPETVQMEYHKNGFTIQIVFFNDRSIWELFKRDDTQITDGDIDGLLEIFAAGHWTWDERSRAWISPDRKLQADRQPGHPDFLSVRDMQTVTAIEERHKANLNGL
jgi:hypothetical protein